MLKKIYTAIFFIMLLAGNLNAQGSCSQLSMVLDGRSTTTGNVCNIFVPRNDLTSVLGLFTLQPEMGIGMELEVLNADGTSQNRFASGYIALQESEVPSVLSYLLGNDFIINAVSNHFLNEKPKIIYVHFSQASADITQTAQQIRQLMNTLGNFGVSGESTLPLSYFDVNAINNTLNLHGQTKAGGVYKAIVQRNFNVLNDWTITKPDGYIAMQGTMGEALLVGQIPLEDGELDPFLNALTSNHINITSINNLRMSQTSQIYLVSFYDIGPSDQITSSLKNVLDTISLQ